jgi:hypothetical protein
MRAASWFETHRIRDAPHHEADQVPLWLSFNRSRIAQIAAPHRSGGLALKRRTKRAVPGVACSLTPAT